MLARYRGSPSALSSQSSPVSVLTRSAPSKHITSLLRPGEGGGRTLRPGQLQSSPAPFSQPGGEFLCQHTNRAHSKTYWALRAGPSWDGKRHAVCSWFWPILFTLARMGGNKWVCVRRTGFALAAKLLRQGADDQSCVLILLTLEDHG